MLNPYYFEGIDGAIAEFKSAKYVKANHKDKSEHVNRRLLAFIQDASGAKNFLLIAAIDYIDRIHREKLLVN